ncbi:hypothetical protein [Caldalkalibacillus mannanilyticus]|uniref:hypothetical protein n=1 Tax=Caldalkalibacillus mannanilyticus TaxID=1418 RepID=UPI000B0C400D|nr:hypothetical protein [Caldalkalibacillus mannanilyticus]
MEFSYTFYLMVGLILWIGLIGMVGNLQLANFYRQWLEKVKGLERKPIQLPQGATDDMLEEMISEYSTHRTEGIEQVNTQAIIEGIVYQKQIYLFGMFRLPVGVVERVLTQLPSWAIIIGLLGTFSGLTLALFAMQGTLLQLGTESGAEVISVSTIVTAIAEPFKGMSFAFITSIAGIGVAFMIHVLQSGLFSKLGVGPSYAQLKQLFLTKCESLLDHQVQQLVQKQKPKDSMEKILDRLVDKVKESFDQSVDRFGTEIIKMTHQLEGSVEGLGKVVEQSLHFTEQFNQGTSELTQFGQVLEKSISSFHQHEAQVAQRIEQLAKQIQALQHELKQLTTKSLEGHQQLQRIVERSDQMMQQSARKGEEMYQFFQKQMEESQRRFHERYAEHERNMKLNQEEWTYKYQEKNDQFSRAAESFGQAVQNLERQWADGLERFKREVTSQWGQLLEKHLGRQNTQGQDKELREIVRELGTLQHVLEREFQQLNRFTNETYQVLISMYEWGRSQMSQNHSQRYDPPEATRSPIARERRY